MIRVCVYGASGRLGASVLQVLQEYPEVVLAAALVPASSELCGKVVSGSKPENEVRYSSDVVSALEVSDVVIDFSTPEASLELCRIASERQVPVAVCTTGFDAAQVETLKSCSSSTAILLAPNTSLGVFVLKELSILARKLLGPEFQIEVMELHHKDKMDAPSGTALSVAESLADTSLHVNNRSSVRQKRGDSELGIASLRGGDAAGEHTIFFLGQGERLELTHRATKKEIFARGALRAAIRLQKLPSGLYSMREVIGAS